MRMVLDHVLHKEALNICKVALKWTSEGKMKRGCLKSTQERILELALWLPKDREEWRNIKSLKLQSTDNNDLLKGLPNKNEFQYTSVIHPSSYNLCTVVDSPDAGS